MLKPQFLVLASIVILGVASPRQSVAQEVRYRVAMRPTDRESREIAEHLKECLYAGDLDSLEMLLDTDALLERARGSSSTAASILVLEELEELLRARAWFGVEVAAAIEAGGDYGLLRTIEKRGEQRALFRLLTSDGGLNYHEMVLERRGLAGPVRVVDVYVHLTGELLSESYRRTFRVASQGLEDSLFERLMRNESSHSDHRGEILRLNDLIREGRHQEALELWDGLPVSMASEKSMLIKRLAITQELGDAEYVATIRKIWSLFPDDPALDLISLDAFILERRYGLAFEVLDRLDLAVGGDPYLDVQRAGLYLLQRNYEEAKRYASRAITREPYLEPAYWTIASVALDTMGWGLLVRVFRGLEHDLALQVRDLTSVPEYHEFTLSPQYRSWRAAR